jgi:hypothetical protein
MNSYDDDLYEQASSCDLCLVMFVFALLLIPIGVIWALAKG